MVPWRAVKDREIRKGCKVKTVTGMVSTDCGDGFSLIDMSKSIRYCT